MWRTGGRAHWEDLSTANFTNGREFNTMKAISLTSLPGIGDCNGGEALAGLGSWLRDAGDPRQKRWNGAGSWWKQQRMAGRSRVQGSDYDLRTSAGSDRGSM